MDYWHDLTPGEDAPDEVAVVVEIPKGSQNKYEYDKARGVFALDRVLFSPIHYPGDYGIIPQTLAEDHDPLDALVLVSYPTYPGILITSRPIGVLHMQDNGEGDDKILCVPVTDIRMDHIKDVNDIQAPIREEIAHFFEVYKQLEGKQVKLGGWDDAAAARRVITESITRYQERGHQAST
jgi:inorganic pyrophosphatase